MMVTSHLTPSSLTTHHYIFLNLQVQICNARIDETALAVYLVMDGVDRCQVGFTSWHLVKHEDKFDGALAQGIEVYSVDDISNHKRQEVYKNLALQRQF